MSRRIHPLFGMVLDSSLCSVRVVVGVKVVALQAEIELTLNRASISNAKVFFILLQLRLIYQNLKCDCGFSRRAFNCSSHLWECLTSADIAMCWCHGTLIDLFYS